MEHDFYWLFNRFWWLIFPIFWMIARIVRLSLRHSNANRALDIIKTYADQGKDPPAELLAALRDRRDAEDRHYPGPEHGWVRFCLFAALAVGFGVLAFIPSDLSEGHEFAFIFVAIVMVGLALGGLISALMKPRPDLPPRDRLQ